MNVVIYGASGQGRITLDLVREQKKNKVCGFIDDQSGLKGNVIDGVQVLGGVEALSNPKNKIKGVFLAIGDGKTREKIYKNVTSLGFEVLGYVHPKAIVSKRVHIHSTSMIWPGAVVHVGVKIGVSTIINTHATVEHDVILGDFVHVAPGAILCGNVQVGDRSWIGAGSTVIQEKKIGEDVMLGAGAVVVKDIGNRLTAYGVPAVIKGEYEK